MMAALFQGNYWPTYQHDNRRTGFTCAASDMTSNSDNDVTMNLATGSSTSRDKLSIDDIDGDGNGDLILTSTEGEYGGRVHLITYKRDYSDKVFKQLKFKISGGDRGGINQIF